MSPGTRPPNGARDDGARALDRLAEAGQAIVAGVEANLPGWVSHQVERILAAWGRCDATTQAQAMAAAETAGTRAATRVSAALRDLFAQDPSQQMLTPLEIVRTAVREPTEVLAGVGIPPVVREDFDVSSWPDDIYGLVPRALSDLQFTQGNDWDLGPLQLVWGHALAAVRRPRST